VKDIDFFLVKKWGWIQKQINELERYQKPEHKKEYLSGESFYYLGRQYMLKIEQGNQEGVKISPGVISLYSSQSPTNSRHNQTIFNEWYLERCNLIFKKELVLALKDYNIKILPNIKIREMKTRWGSYYKGTINLNPKLLQAPKIAIRYVITHELCHTDYKDHSPQFYALLESRMPDWKKIKEELELRFG